MNKDITKRLEALEAARAGAGGLAPTVAIMTLLDDGTWDLSCGLWDRKNAPQTVQSHHQTEEEVRAAYDDFLRRHKRGRKDAVLIIDDLQTSMTDNSQNPAHT